VAKALEEDNVVDHSEVDRNEVDRNVVDRNVVDHSEVDRNEDKIYARRPFVMITRRFRHRHKC